MRNIFGAVMAVLMVPSFAMACAYPGGLRATNATLMSILETGGTVSIHHRQALRRSLDQINPGLVLQSLAQEVPRRDARAAAAVVETATALAEGRGTQIAADMRDTLRRLADAADDSCSGGTDVATGTEDAQSAEQGTGRNTGQGGRPITYREQMTRLSLTFTAYLVFLAGLLGFRRQWSERARRPSAAPVHDPAQAGSRKQA